MSWRSKARENLRFSISVFSIFLATLVLLLKRFPLSAMYSIGTSWEIQQLALFIVDKIDISKFTFEGYGVQFPAPAYPFVVASFYLITRNINLACMISNLVFSILAVFMFSFLSESRKLALTLIFIPYWLVATFTAIPEVAAIFLILLSLYLFRNQRCLLAIGLSALSGLFRLEGFAVPLIMILYSRRWRGLAFPIIAAGAFLSWYQFVFGNPLIMLSSHMKVATFAEPSYMVQAVIEALNSGIYGFGKVTYTLALLGLSCTTVVGALKSYGCKHIYFPLSVYFTLIHTVLYFNAVFFEYPRFFLMLAPITLMVFKRETEKWFLPLCILLAIISGGTTYMFYLKAIEGRVI